MPTERQNTRPKVAKPGVDPGIYLRTYEVISSLDRAEQKPWWEKGIFRIGRGSNSSGGTGPRREIAAPAVELRSLEPVSIAAELPSSVIGNSSAPVLARWQQPSQNNEMALVPLTVLERGLRRPTAQPRAFSWVLLAVVAAITAGLTFALIHFAWHSVNS